MEDVEDEVLSDPRKRADIKDLFIYLFMYRLSSHFRNKVLNTTKKNLRLGPNFTIC